MEIILQLRVFHEKKPRVTNQIHITETQQKGPSNKGRSKSCNYYRAPQTFRISHLSTSVFFLCDESLKCQKRPSNLPLCVPNGNSIFSLQLIYTKRKMNKSPKLNDGSVDLPTKNQAAAAAKLSYTRSLSASRSVPAGVWGRTTLKIWSKYRTRQHLRTDGDGEAGVEQQGPGHNWEQHHRSQMSVSVNITGASALLQPSWRRAKRNQTLSHRGRIHTLSCRVQIRRMC